MKYRLYIDEAGRGPLAGPVYTAIILPLKKFETKQFKDSKTLSIKQRSILYKEIVSLENNNKLLFGSGKSDNIEIDNIGISKAINLSICRALVKIFKKLFSIYSNSQKIGNYGDKLISIIKINECLHKGNIDYTILKTIYEVFYEDYKFQGLYIDGNRDFGLKKNLGINITTIVDGDAKVPEISMASIIAKVERDNEMITLGKKFKNYNFQKHKGYGTQEHRNEIIEYGISKAHRISYLSNLIKSNNLKIPRSPKLNLGVQSTILRQKTKKINKPSLLLHVCCAPDMFRPTEYLSKFFKLQFLWYNPNIDSPSENKRRYLPFETYITKYKLGNIEKIQYNPKEFQNFLYNNQTLIGLDIKDKKKFFKNISEYKEYGKRCELCYLLRLKKTAELAQKHKIMYFTSTLCISPKKDPQKLMHYGKIAENKSKFLFFDFKKNQGYTKSCETTKKLGIYRQNYCGCIWSKHT